MRYVSFHALKGIVVLGLVQFLSSCFQLDSEITLKSKSSNATKIIKIVGASPTVTIEESSTLVIIFNLGAGLQTDTVIEILIDSNQPHVSGLFSGLTLTNASSGSRAFVVPSGTQFYTAQISTSQVAGYYGTKNFDVQFRSSDSSFEFETAQFALNVTDKDPDPGSLPPFTGSICTQSASSAPTGTLYDPGGAGGNYSNNQNCSFTITASSGVVNARLSALALEPFVDCGFDYIQFFDGPDTNAPTISINGKDKFCGSNLPPAFNSSGTTLTVRFFSDGGVVDTGFTFLWTSGLDITPNVFNFTKVDGANFDQVVTQEVTVSGFSGSLMANVTGALGNPEIRNKTTLSAWGQSNVAFGPGEILEVRINAGDFYSKVVSAEVSIGYVSSELFVSTVPVPKFADRNSGIVASTVYSESVVVTGGFPGSMTVSLPNGADAELSSDNSTWNDWATPLTVTSGQTIYIRNSSNLTTIYQPSSVDVTFSLSLAKTATSRWSIFGCPTGYIPVNANNVHTTKDFCVMQYEAKDIAGNPESQENGTPWRNISPANSFAECANHPIQLDYPDGKFALISNDEWMTISRDVEVQADNWGGGAVGSGCFKTGNTAGAESTCSYDGADPEGGSSRNSLAKLKLSNGFEIWDFAGNLWEWVDWDTSDMVVTPTGGSCDGTWINFTNPYDCLGYFNRTVDILPGFFNQLGFWAPPVSPANSYIKRGGHHDVGDSGTPFSMIISAGINSTGSTNGFRCVYRPN